MRNIRTFESFINEEEDADILFTGAGKNYALYMFDTSVENFSGEVRDEDGQCVYKIDKKTLESGAMQTPDDVTGLRKFMIEKKKIGETDVIEMSHDTSSHTTNQTRY